MRPIARSLSVLAVLAALLATAFPLRPASAATRQTCKTVSSSETAKLSASSAESTRSAGSGKVSYKVTVSVKVCLHTDAVNRTVNGRKARQVALSRIDMTTKVSHSGHLPATSGTGGTPDWGALNEQHLAPIGVYDSYASVSVEDVGMRWENGKFRVDLRSRTGQGAGHDNGWQGFQTAHTLYEDLTKAGFSCDANRCKPKKTSISGPTVTYTQGSGAADADEIFTPSEGERTGLRLWVTALGAVRYVEYYWDTGTLCPQVSGCTAKVRPANSVASYAEKRVGNTSMPNPGSRFLGVPSELTTSLP